MSENSVVAMVESAVVQHLIEHLRSANWWMPGETARQAEDQTYTSNEEFWAVFLEKPSVRMEWVKLPRFQVTDWFPRSPGQYHAQWAKYARDDARDFLTERDGVRFFRPEGKGLMMEGGIGSVRFKPLIIEHSECWLCTATSDGLCHTGIPLAVPDYLVEHVDYGFGGYYDVRGQIRILPRFLEGYFGHLERVPQIYVLVDAIEPVGAHSDRTPSVLITPMIYFTARRGQLEQPVQGYVTFAQCRADSVTEQDRAADWMAWYVEQYGEQIITDYDQQRPAFKGVPFGLDNIMSARFSQDYARELLRFEPEAVIALGKAFGDLNVYIEQLRTGDTYNLLGDHRYSAVNIRSPLIRATQNINATQGPDRAARDELGRLADQLRERLQKVPQEEAERAAAVAETARTLVEQATVEKPNRVMTQIYGEGLKKAALNLETVVPEVVPIAAEIVALVARLTG